jgi:signal transduction histidine kinase
MCIQIPTTSLPPSTRPGLAQRLCHSPLLVSAFLVSGLLVSFQLAVTLLHVAWVDPVTDWLRTGLAWLELLVLVFASCWLARIRHPGLFAWWMISAGLLAYAIAQTVWVTLDTFVSPNTIPVPGWSDLFFLLQYPFFFLALVFWPGTSAFYRSAMARVKVVLDCLLLMGATTALSWYFILAPLYRQSGQSLLGKITNLAYPVGDLGVLFGLVIVAFTRQPIEQVALRLLILAVACLAVADSWFTYIDLSTVYITGGPPDVFWMISYALFALAGVAQFRLTQYERARRSETREAGQGSEAKPGQEVMGAIHFLLPLLAAALIAIRVMTAPPDTKGLGLTFVIIVGLLVLAVARQQITLLENTRLQRERAAGQANELAMREANRRMNVFLGIASHELNTPLTNLKLHMQLAQRRLHPLKQQGSISTIEAPPIIAAVDEQLARTETQVVRLSRLVNDLLDVSRIQADRLELCFKPAQLGAIVREAVEEQQQAAPARAIRLHFPAAELPPVRVDPDRLGQVVTNYLTNALKYSPEDRPIDVGVQREGQCLRVWVRDQGPGLSPSEQEHIWERFHRAPGIVVQSGSGIGLGLGLHICKTLIERHSGQVGVDSTPGQGSTFWFSVPLEQASPACSPGSSAQPAASL